MIEIWGKEGMLIHDSSLFSTQSKEDQKELANFRLQCREMIDGTLNNPYKITWDDIRGWLKNMKLFLEFKKHMRKED